MRRIFWTLVYFGGYPIMALASLLTYGNWAEAKNDLSEDYKMLTGAE